MIQIKAMQESQCPDVLCNMLNAVFPPGSFKYVVTGLCIHEDELPQIINDGVLRNKYIAVTELHSKLLEIKKK